MYTCVYESEREREREREKDRERETVGHGGERGSVTFWEDFLGGKEHYVTICI